MIDAGRRFGKTVLAAWEMFGYAFSGQDKRICYIAPTFQQARDIAWQELKRVLGNALIDANETRLELKVRNRLGGISHIWLRGWESIETLRGQRFDFIVLDEVAMMRDFWAMWQEVVRPTLTDTRGHGMFISTPRGFNHFYDLFNMEQKDKDFKSFKFTSYDNPHVPADELDKARLELTEDRFAQEYLADFRKTEGLIFKEFDRTRHVFREPKGPRSRVRKLVGIDWGFTNPAAVLEIVEDGDRNYWVMSEWYKTKKLTGEIVDHAASLAGTAYYPDPAEPDRIEEMRRLHLNVQDVSKDVEAGIDSVRTLFKQDKLFIHESCINLITELESYTYKPKKPDQNTPEEPVKENDHACDALRYVLHMAAKALATNTVARQYTPGTFSYRRQAPRIGA